MHLVDGGDGMEAYPSEYFGCPVVYGVGFL